ncbi:MAG TPA: alpha-galactosidase [Gammaproteobacteria bacterium]|jgi:alpha-galactosidase|nr:alpha-galactosidase [Gammaproteobacteria bacterium]
MNKLVSVSDDLHFHLSNGRISYAFRVSPEGILEHLFFGAAIAGLEENSVVPRRVFRACTLEFEANLNYCLDDTPQEFAVFGRSDNRSPTLHARNHDGNSTFSPLYDSYQVSTGKPDLGELPQAAAGGSETIKVVLKDNVYGLVVELYYTVYADHDAITRSVVLRNEGQNTIVLDQALSTNFDLPVDDYELLHFKGSWSREFEQIRHSIESGRFVVESNKGTSSNSHNPALIITHPHTTESYGDSYSFALMYSGSHAFNVERGEFDSVRINAGISPFNFSWQLEPNTSFACPEVVQVFSDKGLNGMSAVWHGFINSKVIPKQFQGVARPTYLNSWEAHYFDVSEDAVVELAHKAKDVGVEMLVLDDGWFKGRADDTSSLGDWFSDEEKFPNGMASAAKRVRDLGLKFGLWFEPEMVNRKSDLYRAHPQWILQVPHRTLSTGRQQLILDLSNPEVVEYLFERIDDFLSSGQIDYVKWDMNRTMTELGSPVWSSAQQQEVAHRYILGVYTLVRRIIKKHPEVLFENCASGGNRFDLGMLSFMAQGWVSDMSEPIGRLGVFNGASHIYPQSAMASYIGPVPSHQNARNVSIKTRAEVGFFCAARGLSLNKADLEKDHEEIKHYVQLYKASAQDVVSGQLHRLRYSANEVVWQLNSPDLSRVYVGCFHILSGPNQALRRARLVGLEAGARYRLMSPIWKQGQPEFAGDELLNRGIDLPFVDAMQHQEGRLDYSNYMPKGDFASALLMLEKV